MMNIPKGRSGRGNYNYAQAGLITRYFSYVEAVERTSVHFFIKTSCESTFFSISGLPIRYPDDIGHPFRRYYGGELN